MTSTGSYGGGGTYPSTYDARTALRGRFGFRQMVSGAGAVVSLGLVLGMVVWAFQLTTRNVSDVPVIRALDGPMRAAPADPGGVQAAHQGLSVNRLAEGAEAGQVPDRLVLAPPPVELVVFEWASSSAAVDLAPEADPDTPEIAPTHDLIQRLITRNEGGDPLAPAPQDSATVAPVIPDLVPASVAGVAQSLRPMRRPGTTSARAPAPDLVRVTPELDAATLPEGTRLVQLGAFDTPEIAKAEWDRLTARFPDYMSGRARVIQEASSGGSPFFRLRAHGFDDLAATRRFCAALSAQNAPCIPVTVR